MRASVLWSGSTSQMGTRSRKQWGELDEAFTLAASRPASGGAGKVDEASPEPSASSELWLAGWAMRRGWYRPCRI